MVDVYDECPVFENSKYRLRLICDKDLEDLLKVYSDKKAVPFFNSDNCNGDNFYYTTLERMKEAIDFWKDSYKEKWFVRWAIVDKQKQQTIGAIEVFHRDAEDYFTNCALLRLDLRSDYEEKDEIVNILRIIIDECFLLFDCKMIATKAIKNDEERIVALKELGFAASDEKLVGHDGTKYLSYFIKNK